MLNLATNMATGLASRLGSNLAPSDFRFSIPGIQASFRRGSSDEYVTPVGSDIQSLVDAVPRAYKSVAHSPYVVSAPDPSQRPSMGPGGAMVFSSANSNGLSTRGNGTLLGALLNGTQACTFYSVVSAADGAQQTAVGVGRTDASASYFYMAKQAANTLELRRITSGDGDEVESDGSLDTQAHVWAGVFSGDNLDLYIDGVHVGGPVATDISYADLNVLSLGYLDRSSPAAYLNGSLWESLVCLVSHDAAGVAAVTSGLQMEHGL